MCQALYEYVAQNDDELSLKLGDLITLISKDGQDKGWWRGELRGRVGVFPDNFVTVFPVPADQSTTTLNPPTTPKKSEVSPQLVVKIFPQAPINAIRKDPPLSCVKPINNVAMQRKSLEAKAEGISNLGPPIPGKKPIVPMKKSPSLTGGGLLSGLKNKVLGGGHDKQQQSQPQPNYDNIDGVGGSKMKVKEDERMTSSMVVGHSLSDKPDEFDQVERQSMLVDPRANRARAPGRRPPSMVSKLILFHNLITSFSRNNQLT